MNVESGSNSNQVFAELDDRIVILRNLELLGEKAIVENIIVDFPVEPGVIKHRIDKLRKSGEIVRLRPRRTADQMLELKFKVWILQTLSNSRTAEILDISIYDVVNVRNKLLREGLIPRKPSVIPRKKTA